MRKNKLPDYYIYPATFIYNEGQEIAVVFYDLGCATSGVDDADALKSARELLGITMYGMEKDGEEIPAPTQLDQIPIGENEHTVLVDVYMPSIRMAGETKAVSRTVTIPAWLNAIAIEHNVNFSQVLQNALKEYLHLTYG